MRTNIVIDDKLMDTALSGLQKYNMVNFELADFSEANYRLIRKKGITVRKTIDMLNWYILYSKRF